MPYRDKGYSTMLGKADQKFESAKDDFEKQRYDSCISNLYYSAFQTVSALLILRNEYLKKHTHVRAFVNKELANKGLMQKDLAKIYNKLMDYRSDADYNNEIFFEKEKAKEMILGVEAFNKGIKIIIKNEGNMS